MSEGVDDRPPPQEPPRGWLTGGDRGPAELKTARFGPRQIAVLKRLVGSTENWRARFDLLVFLGRYPEGCYNRRALKPLTSCPPREVRSAVDQLVERGAIEVRREGAATYYLFTAGAEVRDTAKALGRLTPGKRQQVLDELLGAPADDGPRRKERGGNPAGAAAKKGGRSIGESVQ